MANQPKLGKIEKVNVRDVWPHEALNFTKWLAQEENLTMLGDACSIELELKDTESAVGSFAVDIFAQEADTERKVIIENQLEDTNHDHLGKIITYAAGKGAGVVIWVVARARDEHRNAIEWLNEHTDSDCAFFLVEIEVWRIGDSPMAPRFNVVESPNEWARAEKAKSDLSETERIKLEYWQTYVDCAAQNETFSQLFKPHKPQAHHWTELGAGSIRYHLVLLINTQKKQIGVEACVHDTDFGDFVLSRRQELEQALGIAGTPYNRKSRGVRFYKSGHDIKANREKWPEFIDWQLNMITALQNEMVRLENEFETIESKASALTTDN